MPRVSEPVDDTTPLTASRIDIPARIGWLMRSHRTVAGLSLRQMSAALREHGIHLSSTTLGRIESEGQISPAALDGYAAVLGVPGGLLRSTVEGLCFAFAYAPPLPAEPARGSLTHFSAAVAAADVEEPTGQAWLGFVRHHASRDGFGLPEQLMRPYVRRLLVELIRAVGPAMINRQTAVSTLLGSAYGDLVDSLMREMVLSRGTQRIDWLTSVQSERPTASLLSWYSDLLAHDSVVVARAGSYAIQSMLVAGGLSAAEWATLVPGFVRAWERGTAERGVRRDALAQLCAALPPALRLRILETCHVSTEPTVPTQWSRSRHNAHYEFSRSVARDACARLGHHDEPLLERVLFEALFDPRGVRMSTSKFLVQASPFVAEVVNLLVARADDAPDDSSRTAATRIAAFCHPGHVVPGAERLLGTGSVDDLRAGLTIHGQSGQRVPDAVVRRSLDGDESTVLRVLMALGHTQDDRLAGLAETGVTAEVRDGARWWLEHGGRVLV